MYSGKYRAIGSMEDRILKEQRRLEAKQKPHKKKKKKKNPSKKQVIRAIKLSHQLDSMYFKMLK